MNIKTKYEIGQHIWVVYENQKEVSVYDDKIESIAIDKDEWYYTTEETYIEVSEQDIILYEDKEKLANKIESLMKEIREREEK